MTNLQRLQVRRAECYRKIDALRRTVNASDRMMTDDERAELARLSAEFDRLESDEPEARAQDDRLRRLTPPIPDVEDGGDTGASHGSGSDGRMFRLFPDLARGGHGWKSAGEFLAVLHSGMSDPRLRIGATATGHTPADGGFSVPVEYVAAWLDQALENEIVRPRATVIGMKSDTQRWPGWSGADHSTGLFGGLASSGQWISEATSITPTTAKMRLIELKARKLAILAELSNELIADGVGYELQLERAIIGGIGFYADHAFLRGDGSNKPLGVLNAPCTVSVTRNTTGRVLYDDCIGMLARLHPSCFGRAVWVAHPSVIPDLLQLAVTVGVGGAPIPVMSDKDGKLSLLTRPVIITEKLPALGTAGDIVLADFSQYVIGLRADMTIAKSAHAGFGSDTAYFRGILRVDGQPTWDAAVTPASGTGTLSPFVTLTT